MWEVVIKRALGRPDVRIDPRLLRRGPVENGYTELPVTGDHALTADLLPPLHKDPFDRLLVAQALAEGSSLVTANAQLSAYPGDIGSSDPRRSVAASGMTAFVRAGVQAAVHVRPVLADTLQESRSMPLYAYAFEAGRTPTLGLSVVEQLVRRHCVSGNRPFCHTPGPSFASGRSGCWPICRYYNSPALVSSPLNT